VQTKNPAFLWFALFAIYLILNFVQGMSHVAFPYTMVYALAFLLMSIALSKGSGALGTLFGFMAFIVATLTWITSGGYITSQTGMMLSFVFSGVALLNEYGILEYGGRTVNSRYFLLGAFGGIFLFGLLYFLSRLGFIPVGFPPTFWVGELPWYTVLNHLGIMLLAGIDMILMLRGGWEKYQIYRWAFFAMTLVGALAIIWMNFGLAIL